MGLADDVAADVPKDAARKTWFQLLPAEAADELLELRRRYQAGDYGTAKRLHVARAAVERCQERGWKTCDATRMAQWLMQNG
jgi:hypothetical protein